MGLDLTVAFVAAQLPCSFNIPKDAAAGAHLRMTQQAAVRSVEAVNSCWLS